MAPRSSIVDYGVAAASGAFAATGIGTGASIAANAALSGTAYILDCELEGENVDTGRLAFSIVVGIAAGAIGGPGADGAKLMGVVKTSRNVLKTAVSPKKIAMYSAKIAASGKATFVSTIRTITAGGVGNIANIGYNNIQPLLEK